MPKSANSEMKTVRTPARPQPSRAIKRFAPPAGRTESMAQGARMFADAITPSPKGRPAGDGRIMPKQMVY
jgi:hypothetical protein